jgi:pimeloyl-ACP methyl ester carboxylesterase
VAVCLLSFGVQAKTVHLDTATGVSARADYQPGQPDKPAVLVLHGMLQTHGVRTVRTLADSLSANGHPVLTPTLSLGVAQRQQSLDCDAIHSHTLGEDIGEIRAWVDWLARRATGPIVLVGHSTGGLKLLAYLQEDPHPRVSRLVAVSLAGFASWTKGVDAAAEIEQARAQGEQELHEYSLGYCADSYKAPPEPFLSYMRWNAERIERALAESPVPVKVVLGSQDRRLPPRWPQRVAEQGARVQVVEGAGHFFTGLHELALGDAVRAVLGGGEGD